MAGLLKIAAFSLTGVFVIFFSLIFFTRLGQSRNYKFFIGELSILTSVTYGLMVDPNAGFLNLPFILPFIGCVIPLIIGSFLFWKAAFAAQGQNTKVDSP